MNNNRKILCGAAALLVSAGFFGASFLIPELSELFEEGRSKLDESARKETYAKLQAAVQDTGAFYPIISNNKILVVNNRAEFF